MRDDPAPTPGRRRWTGRAGATRPWPARSSSEFLDARAAPGRTGARRDRDWGERVSARSTGHGRPTGTSRSPSAASRIGDAEAEQLAHPSATGARCWRRWRSAPCCWWSPSSCSSTPRRLRTPRRRRRAGRGAAAGRRPAGAVVGPADRPRRATWRAAAGREHDRPAPRAGCALARAWSALLVGVRRPAAAARVRRLRRRCCSPAPRCCWARRARLRIARLRLDARRRWCSWSSTG